MSAASQSATTPTATGHAPSSSPLWKLWQRTEGLPLGNHLASQALRFFAPYFRTVPIVIEDMGPGFARTRMRAVPWTRNHLRTTHAIALCNLAELTMGAAAEATVPATHRWVPRAMQVEYVALAKGTMHGTCEVTLPEDLDRVSVPFPVEVRDADGQIVFTASIDLWITPKR